MALWILSSQSRMSKTDTSGDGSRVPFAGK
jgi:hypothetical protein